VQDILKSNNTLAKGFFRKIIEGIIQTGTVILSQIVSRSITEAVNIGITALVCMTCLVPVTEYISSRLDDNIEITQSQENNKFKLLKKIAVLTVGFLIGGMIPLLYMILERGKRLLVGLPV